MWSSQEQAPLFAGVAVVVHRLIMQRKTLVGSSGAAGITAEGLLLRLLRSGCRNGCLCAHLRGVCLPDVAIVVLLDYLCIGVHRY